MRKIEHKLIDGVEYKLCSHCKQWKPLSEFSKNKKNWDELRGFCKECNKQYYPKYTEKIKQYNAQYYQNHKEYFTKYGKQYYQDHKEEILEYCVKYYRTIEGFSVRKYHNHLFYDIGKDFFTKETIPPNYITPQVLMELYKRPDFYDGKLYDWSLMSIDRIDESKPHTLDNIVACTWEHNNDRHYKHMTVEEYKEHIQKMEG